MSIFSERLMQIKKDKNVLQKDIARAIGLSLRQYQAYEYGHHEPTMHNIIKICQFFNCSSDWLLGLSEDKTIHSPTISPSDEKAATI